MKKLIITLSAILASVTAYALPVGNPWDASLLCDGIFCEGNCCRDRCDVPLCDAVSFRLGFYGDYVFDRHVEINSKERSDSVHRFEINTNAAYLAVNFWDRLDLFATLGTSHLLLEAPEHVFGVGNNYIILETETDFSYSFGARLTLWECGCFGVGAEAQYFHTKPHINYEREEDEPPTYVSFASMRYREWQVGLGAAYRIDIGCTAVIPYLAVKAARALISAGDAMINGETFVDLETERTWGYAVGVTLLGCNKASLSVEGRFADERALYVNSQFRY